MDTSPEQLRKIWENDQEVRSLLRPDLMTYIPDSSPGITICAVPDSGSEDACAISYDKTRFAISDGVSRSELPRPWAAMIVQKWVNDPIFSPDQNQWQEWLRKPRIAWRLWVSDEWINHINQNMIKLGKEPKDKTQIGSSIKDVFSKGGSATFLGVNIDTRQQRVKALALGDSCMFLIHPNNSSYESFPLKSPADFGNLPDQLGSLGGQAGHFKEMSFTYSQEDILILATDAISKWLMRGLNDDFDKSLEILRGLNNQNFERFIEQGRKDRQIEVDDTTLMVVFLKRYTSKPDDLVLPPPLSPRSFRRV